MNLNDHAVDHRASEVALSAQLPVRTVKNLTPHPSTEPVAHRVPVLKIPASPPPANIAAPPRNGFHEATGHPWVCRLSRRTKTTAGPSGGTSGTEDAAPRRTTEGRENRRSRRAPQPSPQRVGTKLFDEVGMGSRLFIRDSRRQKLWSRRGPPRDVGTCSRRPSRVV